MEWIISYDVEYDATGGLVTRVTFETCALVKAEDSEYSAELYSLTEVLETTSEEKLFQEALEIVAGAATRPFWENRDQLMDELSLISPGR